LTEQVVLFCIKNLKQRTKKQNHKQMQRCLWQKSVKLGTCHWLWLAYETGYFY